MFLFFITFFFSAQLHSSTANLSKIPCSSEVFSHISSLGTPKKWHSESTNEVYTNLSPDGYIKIKVENNKTQIRGKAKGIDISGVYISPKCNLKLNSLFASDNSFTDISLDHLLSNNKSGVIYIWSPHMSLSLQELSELKSFLKTNPKKMLILMDLNADEATAKKSSKKYNLPASYLKRVNSRKLEKFGSNIHFPSLIFYKNKKLVKLIPGYSGKELIQVLMKRYL